MNALKLQITPRQTCTQSNERSADVSTHSSELHVYVNVYSLPNCHINVTNQQNTHDASCERLVLSQVAESSRRYCAL